jgi:tryptophan halogenase
MAIDNIVIVGGGSSGWLTAAHLSHNLPEHVKITLIESTRISSLGKQGIGEGTQPFTTPFLFNCGLKFEDWMLKADCIHKYGVEFINWASDNIFVDNDTQEMGVLGPNVMFHNYWLAKKPTVKEYFDCMPSYTLAKNNKAPKAGHQALDYTPGFLDPPHDAFHFDAQKLAGVLKEHCKDRINYINDVIVEVKINDYGVDKLITQSKQEVTADLFIDCSGFKSILLEGALHESFDSLENILFNNNAVVIHTEYKDKHKEMHPYTKAFAMDAGWRWSIPTYSRIGNGYVYSDKFITKDEAETVLRKTIKEYNAPAYHIKMKTGTHNRIAVKNVYAVGLAAGFVEPLEATGISFATFAIHNLTKCLIDNNGELDKDFLNSEYNISLNEIINFVFLHYALAFKQDTPYWKATKQVPYPEGAKIVLDKFVPNPPNTIREKGYFGMFHVGQWFSLLYGYNMYNKYVYNIDDHIVKYGNWVNTMYVDRTKHALDIFPNQFDYLKNFYKG